MEKVTGGMARRVENPLSPHSWLIVLRGRPQPKAPQMARPFVSLSMIPADKVVQAIAICPTLAPVSCLMARFASVSMPCMTINRDIAWTSANGRKGPAPRCRASRNQAIPPRPKGLTYPPGLMAPGPRIRQEYRCRHQEPGYQGLLSTPLVVPPVPPWSLPISPPNPVVQMGHRQDQRMRQDRRSPNPRQSVSSNSPHGIGSLVH